MPTELIFVYGTLRKNVSPNQHALLAEHAEYIADGTIQAKLFNIGHYPAISESSNRKHQVSGELYKLHNSNKSLALLDDYEACSNAHPTPHEYIRKILPVTLNNGESVTAWVYVYNLDTSGLSWIESGDYAQRDIK